MSKYHIEYDYIVRNLGTKKDPAYKAYIPAFNGTVYADSHEELEEGIFYLIEAEKELRKIVPPPDKHVSSSGKLVVRLKPGLHERLAFEAKAHGKSLNTYLQEKISA